MHELFEDIVDFPDPEIMDQYASLVGLDDLKSRLMKEGQLLIAPSLLDDWNLKQHGGEVPFLSYFKERPPLFIFAGDVGTGKTALAGSFGDPIARKLKIDVKLYSLSLNTRGTGAVGEMTRLISGAFDTIKQEAQKTTKKHGKPSVGYILLIDEADALAQSREFAQMHHEDRAGVNALIRGIDDIAHSNLPVITVMCTNRLNAIDPAVHRRAAGVFRFSRPNEEQRQYLLEQSFQPLKFNAEQIEDLVQLTGKTESRPYGFTYSDLTQRFFPTIILDAFPDHPITFEQVVKVVGKIEPTPPFQEQR